MLTQTNLHISSGDAVYSLAPNDKLASGALTIGSLDGSASIYPPADPSEAVAFLGSLIEQCFALADAILATRFPESEAISDAA
jgi:hypothetical protein